MGLPSILESLAGLKERYSPPSPSGDSLTLQVPVGVLEVSADLCGCASLCGLFPGHLQLES